MTQVTLRSNFRCRLNKEQTKLFFKTTGSCRFVWNNRVAGFNSSEKSNDLTIKELKSQFPFLSEVPYNALEQTLQDWNTTKKQFFNKNRKTKLGRPKFKSKKNGKFSFRVSYNGFSLKKGYLSISKFGKIKVFGLEELISLSEISSITLKMLPSGKFYISVAHKAEKKEKEKTRKSIGIDLGLTHFIIDSQGNKIENPRFYRKEEEKLKILQRALSKKVKGSVRYFKCKKKISILHEKIVNRRNHFLHKLSNEIIDSNDNIFIENLAVKNMVKNKRYSKSIYDASWSKFTSMLEYKALWYGRNVYKINRFFASSKTCSECGYQLSKLDVSIREWTCSDCGSIHDRDINAAKNILLRGEFELQMGANKPYLKKSDMENQKV